MSVPFSGTFTRSGGIYSAIAKRIKSVNLKPVKKVVYKFDPFHEKVEQTRLFMYHLNCMKVLQTNILLKVKTEIVCDRSDPSIVFNLNNGDTVELRSKNLTVLEMLDAVNKHISSLVPKEEPLSDLPTSKISKKIGKKLGKK